MVLHDEKRKHYDALKVHDGTVYTGMAVGGSHSWKYNNGIWNENKVSPDKWEFTFTSNKERARHAPPGTGALVDTAYHWYIVADQKVSKLDENTYSTAMSGMKFKVGHKRPAWKAWSYEYHNESYEDIAIAILKGIIEDLEKRKQRRCLDHFLDINGKKHCS